MAVTAFEHINTRCADVEVTRAFYERCIGLTVGPRPAFASKGYWMYLNGHPVLHLVQRPAGEPAKADTGNLDHLAFRGTDLSQTKATLTAAAIAFRERAAPDGAVQIFVLDPDGLKIELNFS